MKPGDPYRPSNGTEGLGFMEVWCFECERDRSFMDGTGDGCEIAARVLALKPGEDGYPSEWTYNEEGRPVCTAFVEIGKAVPTDIEREELGQLTLLEEDG